MMPSKLILGTFIICSILLPDDLASHSFPQKWDLPFGVSADRTDIVIDPDLKIPPPISDGKLPTLNKMGYMTHDQSSYSLNFINFVGTCSKPVLDVGAAYGIVTLPSIESGATVIANDLDERHLLLLREQLSVPLRKNLILNSKRFPNETEFPDNSLSAVMLSKMVHFLTDQEMEIGLTKIYNWLHPGGRVYIVTMSPYHYLLKDYLPIYKDNVKKGMNWPGLITNMHTYAPELKDQIPNFLHVMDSDSLGHSLKRKGFIILEEGLFDYGHTNAKIGNGQGHYGVIAQKPN